MTFQYKRNKHYSILLISLSIFTIFHLLSKIDKEFSVTPYASLESSLITEKAIFSCIKSEKNLGWFKLEHTENYDKSADFTFICFQYMVAPTVLENETFTNKIICHYTTPVQLINFCKNNRKYRIIRPRFFTNFALLDRIN